MSDRQGRRGLFITFEGMDGSGKSTQIAYLEAELRALGREVLVLREPGGTPVGDWIRALLLDPAFSEMEPVTEMLLYAASRAQLVRERIRPALADGKIVVCDRFLDSSLAYQAAGRGLDGLVMEVNRCAVDGLQPDRTFFIDVPPAAGRSRISGNRELDRIERENEDFQNRVYAGFLAVAERDPGRVLVIDGRQEPETVRNAVWSSVEELLRSEEA